MRPLLDPKVDFVFKRIFGSEANKDVLLAFLNETFKASRSELLKEITLVNPYIDKNAVHDKQSILDIRAVTEDGKQINIEIQLFNRHDIEKRTLYYWSKLYEEQLGEGHNYRDLKKTITINIINFRYLPGESYHHVFHLREDHSGIVLTDDLEIHFMELPKLEEEPFDMGGGLVKWLLFLKGLDKSKWEEIAVDQPELRKAMTTLEFLSQDREARYLYEMRRKALLDERSMMEGAREEGMAEGKAQVAKNLLQMGMEIASIAKATGLTEAEIRKLAEPDH
ncbi:Rpn family recombination-promoting nuclease/putative transposase [Kroppenstedtia eburnea]|uniref:Rpn family recombination-promoting nuclease/putative transposase n=1 Tax=Kroppenstedtia eburnea TaxID=714067 RepID=A0A1N7KLP9_9BACL|nr:Rpn family recombination-promoting nuclease/putative transposase [Kroppenstedtia eburnea]EGK12292.1 hypothetical protein HMPREF9374_1612 [Desmospora sp. 8437]QKI82916.1 PD-(D/E)XK nuclease family transposase [Kroppenstedtia eburnea]SIS62498.1 conserved hypothetical protein (putative transposase or invertase) [Kroppenstedtia eburnea]